MGLPSFSPAVTPPSPLTDAFHGSSTSSHFQLTTPGRGANQLTLLSTRRVLANHIAAGIAPAELELKMSMVPYQEVQGTSQTLVWKSRAGSQPGSNAPPAGLI